MDLVMRWRRDWERHVCTCMHPHSFLCMAGPCLLCDGCFLRRGDLMQEVALGSAHIEVAGNQKTAHFKTSSRAQYLRSWTELHGGKGWVGLDSVRMARQRWPVSDRALMSGGFAGTYIKPCAIGTGGRYRQHDTQGLFLCLWRTARNPNQTQLCGFSESPRWSAPSFIPQFPTFSESIHHSSHTFKTSLNVQFFSFCPLWSIGSVSQHVQRGVIRVWLVCGG